MTGYEELYHVTGWHKEGSSHYGKAEDYGFHYKENLHVILDRSLSDLSYDDYLQVEKVRFMVPIRQKEGEE